MVRKVSKEVEQEIINQYYDATAKELGEKYNVNPNTVKGIWQRNGLTGKNKVPFTQKDFIEYYNSHNVVETAKHYNVDRHTVTKYAKKYGIYKKKESILTPEQEQEIIQSYYKNTGRVLAEKYNVSISKIHQIWSQAGLFGKTARVYTLDENYFQTINTDDKAYWAGFIAADGCIYQPKDTRQDMLSISLKLADIHHLEKFASSIKTDKKISIVENSSRKGYFFCNLQLSSNKISQDLQKINILPRKTYNPKMPIISKELVPAFLRGYFDGDGSISRTIQENKLYAVSVTLVGFNPLITQLKEIIESYGIRMGITFDTKGKYTHPGFCTIYCKNKKDKNNFLHLIYDDATIYLDRKYELAQQYFSLFDKNPITWTLTK